MIKRFTSAGILLLTLAACSNDKDTFQGYIEGEYIYLASPFSGKLTALYVQRGDQVATNQPLFMLDPQPQITNLAESAYEKQHNAALLADLKKGKRETEIDAIEADIKRTQAELAFAKKRLERMRYLFESGAGDQDSFDEATSHYQETQQSLSHYQANLADAKLTAREDLITAQQALVDVSQAAYEQAEWTTQQKKVFAPTSSFVFDTYYKPGEFINAGQPVLSLLAPDNIDAIFFLPEPLLSRIYIGQTVLLTCDSCPKTYKADIYYISPQAEYTPPVIYSREDNYKLVYRIKAKPQQPTLFSPGQPVEVTIPTTPSSDHHVKQ